MLWNVAALKNQLCHHDTSTKYWRNRKESWPKSSSTRWKPVNACRVRQTEIKKAHVLSKGKMKTNIRIGHNSMERTCGVSIGSFAALLWKKASRRIDGRSRHGNSGNSLQKIRPMATTCLKHKNDSWKGQIWQRQHPKRRKMIMQARFRQYCKLWLRWCLYARELLKLNMRMTQRRLGRCSTHFTTSRRQVVYCIHCVGVSVLINQLCQSRARVGYGTRFGPLTSQYMWRLCYPPTAS